jgi:hypothetical protein
MESRTWADGGEMEVMVPAYTDFLKTFIVSRYALSKMAMLLAMIRMGVLIRCSSARSSFTFRFMPRVITGLIVLFCTTA